MPNDPRWTTAGPDILAEDTLNIVRHALEAGWICGIHLYFGGGGSGDAVAFSTFSAFHSHVVGSKPGDLFVLWSIARMRNEKLILVDNRFDSASDVEHSVLSQDDLERVRGYLAKAEFNEILMIKPGKSGELEAILTDLAGSFEDSFLSPAQDGATLGDAVCVLPFTLIDRPELYLAKAKRPNAKGEVPLGGAY